MSATSIGDLSSGIVLPMRALGVLLGHRGLKRYAALPILMNALIYAVCLGVLFYLLNEWELKFEWEFWGPVGAWLSSSAEWTFTTFKWVVVVPIALMASYFTFTLLGTILAIPFLDMLSERVERALCRPKEELSLPLTLTARQIFLGMIDAAWILLKQISWTILALPLLLIPGVGFIPLFLVSAYFTALGFFDIAMARNYLRHRHKKPAIRRCRWKLLGLGVAMQLLFFIPFCGLFLLPIGAVAGTMMYCDLDWPALLRENDLDTPTAFRPPRRLLADR